MLEENENDAYLRWLFTERQCVRLVLLTQTVAVICMGQTPRAETGEMIDIERSTISEKTWEWLEGMSQSADEVERSFESARVEAERERMKNAFEWSRAAAEDYRRTLSPGSLQTATA